MATPTPQPDGVRNAAYQAFWLLRIGFTMAPILFGIDKFFNWTVHWPDYLAGWINDLMPGSAQDFMYFVGAVEIAAGLIVAVAPLIGCAARCGLAFRDHRQPAHERPARVLRHRAARLRIALGRTHPDPARFRLPRDAEGGVRAARRHVAALRLRRRRDRHHTLLLQAHS
jgi:DoxX